MDTVRFTTPLTKSAVRRAASWGPSLSLACKAKSQVLSGCGSPRRSTSSPQRAKRRSAGMDTCASCAGEVPLTRTRVRLPNQQRRLAVHGALIPWSSKSCWVCLHALRSVFWMISRFSSSATASENYTCIYMTLNIKRHINFLIRHIIY